MRNNLVNDTKEKLALSLRIMCYSMLVLLNSSFILKDVFVNIANTPFPQTGSIKVYKYKFASSEKNQIGELQWTAITEYDSNYKWGAFSKVTLKVNNTTDEYIDTFFSYKGGTGSITVNLRPSDVFETTEICEASVTGVVPARTEIIVR